MAIGKRLRYEILRRDNHACRYCGAAAPEAKLTVDHVIPRTLGGSDDPTNLVTACAPCNSGKTSTSPDSPIVDDVAADALRWARAMERAAEMQRQERTFNDLFIGYFLVQWKRYGEEDCEPVIPLGDQWWTSILNFQRAGLDAADLTAAIATAMQARHIPHERVWRYFCGVSWRLVEQRREIAAQLIQVDEVTADGS